MKHISSRDNPRFKFLKKLGQNSRERQKTGQTILDGFHLVEAYSKRYGALPELWVSETGKSVPEIAIYLDRMIASAQIIVLSDALFTELATVDTPSGIMALIEIPRTSGVPDSNRDSVLLDGIQDPGNLGSILRTAAAAGCRQILLSEDCAQAWAPRTLRAAMGAHFHLDIYEDVDLMDFSTNYRGQTLVTAMNAKTQLWECDLRPSTAWIFGNEGQGVRKGLQEVSCRRVSIPMSEATESINVAAAAAICLFETQRQRRVKP